MQPDREKSARNEIDGATHCRILALEPPHRFAFAWFVPGSPETLVSLELEAMDETRTRVSFCHDGWDRLPADAVAPIRTLLEDGWRRFVLPNLKLAAETE